MTEDVGQGTSGIFLAILADACVGRLGREAVASARIGKLEGTEKMRPFNRAIAHSIVRYALVLPKASPMGRP